MIVIMYPNEQSQMPNDSVITENTKLKKELRNIHDNPQPKCSELLPRRNSLEVKIFM
jgi:hypothetical protein